MRYGEVWHVSGLARDRHIVIVSADSVNGTEQFSSVQGIPVVDEAAAPTHLLVATLTHPFPGKALIAQVGPARKARLSDRGGLVPSTEMEQIRRGLSALYDL